MFCLYARKHLHPDFILEWVLNLSSLNTPQQSPMTHVLKRLPGCAQFPSQSQILLSTIELYSMWHSTLTWRLTEAAATAGRLFFRIHQPLLYLSANFLPRSFVRAKLGSTHMEAVRLVLPLHLTQSMVSVLAHRHHSLCVAMFPIAFLFTSDFVGGLPLLGLAIHFYSCICISPITPVYMK